MVKDSQVRAEEHMLKDRTQQNVHKCFRELILTLWPFSPGGPGVPGNPLDPWNTWHWTALSVPCIEGFTDRVTVCEVDGGMKSWSLPLIQGIQLLHCFLLCLVLPARGHLHITNLVGKMFYSESSINATKSYIRFLLSVFVLASNHRQSWSQHTVFCSPFTNCVDFTH